MPVSLVPRLTGLASGVFTRRDGAFGRIFIPQ